MKNLLLLLIIFSISEKLSSQSVAEALENETGTLLVMVEGLKNTEGQLMVALFNSSADFPNKEPYKGSITVISASKVMIRFENLPYGDYAVAVLHDIDKDGKMDKNVFGIPTEGYGFSNNAMEKFGPPSFFEASFVFERRAVASIIDLEYGIPK